MTDKLRELAERWTSARKAVTSYEEGCVDARNTCADELLATLNAEREAVGDMSLFTGVIGGVHVGLHGSRESIEALDAFLADHSARSVVVSDEDVRDAARWRFFCDNIGREYGDGYTEPRENSACLEWQQGPWIRDGSNGGQGRADTFPGWSAIIDKMMEDERRSLEELDEPIDAAIKGERHE